MLSRADQGSGAPADAPAPPRFTIDRWQMPEPPGMLGIDVRISLDGASFVQSVTDAVTRVSGAFADVFGVTIPLIQVSVNDKLRSGEYEIRVGGGVRFAGSFATPWLAWWSEHPAAGIGGRTGLAGPRDALGTGWSADAQIARAVEEVLFDDPGLFLVTGDGVRSALAGTSFGYWSAAELGAMLRELAKVRIPLKNKEALDTALKETDDSDATATSGPSVQRVERISSSLLPNTVRVSLGTGLAGLADKNGPLMTDALPRLRETLYFELGVAFPRFDFSSLRPSADNARTYEITINDVPRAVGFLPASGAYIDEPVEKIAELMQSGATAADAKAPEPWIHPATGKIGCWVDAATVSQASGAQVIPPADILTAHLAMCLREAASEFTDLAWTERVLEQLDDEHPALRKELRAQPDELLATVLARLVAEGNSLRALPQIAARLLEFKLLPNSALVLDEPGLQCEADWLADDPVSLAEYVRSGLKNEILYRHSGGTNVLRVLLLDTGDLEKSLHRAVWATRGDESVYEFEHAAAFLRRLRDASERAHAQAILTDVLLRPYVRRLIAAQFPLLPVLSYQELPMTAEIRVRSRISLED